MSRIRLTICLLSLMLLPIGVRADVVTDWNEVTLQAIKSANLPATKSSRLLAMVHVAIYDAVNAYDRSHASFYNYSSSPRGPADPDAAAVSAAYTVLMHEVPTLQSTFYQQRTLWLGYIPNGRAKQNGVSWGTYVGQVVSSQRAGDGWNWSAAYKPVYEPGHWRPTLPAYAPAVTPQWVNLEPFCMINVEDYIPPPPPALSSQEYADGVNETKRLGAKNSAERTADETETAYFWADDSKSISPPGRWNRVAQVVSQQMGNSMYDNARLFALLNLAMADSTIACWHCKFGYALWRPITAIREADSAGNPLVVQDPTWLPLLNTPAFPEYTAGHSTLGGAAAEVLASFFGTDDIPFDLYSEVTGTTRHFSSFTQACDENGRSRIFAGIHYQFSNLVGIQTGREIGSYVIDHELLAR